ncbi:hypothetical protein [Actinomyces faecalis]|uniref:hypothetical protein n=1 Tax=Actinomyces faecalis TaxID=2722820 RepID=UPI0015521739|nr:hypothetical protein [Actinomyces faecalis]
MRRAPLTVVAVAVVALAGTLGACSDKEPLALTKATPTATAEPSVNPVLVKAAKVYRQVLANPVQYLGLEDGMVPQEVSYALDALGDSSTPRLVLQATGLGQDQESLGVLRVISVQPQGEDVEVLDSDHMVGVASAGGFRGQVTRSSTGEGLIYTWWLSGTGEGEVTRITADANGFTEEQLCEGQVVQTSCLPDGEQGEEITWTDASDTSVLDALENGEWEPGASTGASASASQTGGQAETGQGTPLGQGGKLTKDQPAATSPDGSPVYTGTVRMTDYDGVLALQGQQDPNPGAGQYSPGPYALLVLDQPQEVVATNGDGQGTSSRTASMVLLGYADQASAWSQYDGQHISVSHPASQTFWPSDTSLPLGEPRLTGTATVLTR